jgi:hypothetical protein
VSAPATPLPPAPSGRTLAKATLVALVLAGIVLVTTVLPAEYGIDPLGTGKALGLSDLFAAGAEVTPSGPATIVATEGGPVFSQSRDYRVDTRSFTIPPGSGLEFKYVLDKGSTILYAWKATNFVDFDFHTEPAGQPKGTSDSFEKGEGLQKRGSYTAPYDGIHGWYWENKGTSDVTVALQSAGYYTEARLFLPKTPPQVVEIPARP